MFALQGNIESKIKIFLSGKTGSHIEFQKKEKA